MFCFQDRIFWIIKHDTPFKRESFLNFHALINTGINKEKNVNAFWGCLGEYCMISKTISNKFIYWNNLLLYIRI